MGIAARTPTADERIGTRQHYRWLLGIAKAVLLLNLLDALFTLYWVYSGLAREANPLLDDLLRHPVLFMAVKLTLVSGGSWLLWIHRNKPLAVIAVFIAFLTYYFILLVHLGFLGELIRALT
jgi:hypothetical protein